jgi:MFS family permease
MPIVGSLSDVRGRKKFIAIGLFLYALVSLGFILDESPEILIVDNT